MTNWSHPPTIESFAGWPLDAFVRAGKQPGVPVQLFRVLDDDSEFGRVRLRAIQRRMRIFKRSLVFYVAHPLSRAHTAEGLTYRCEAQKGGNGWLLVTYTAYREEQLHPIPHALRDQAAAGWEK